MKFAVVFVAILATANCQWKVPNLGRGQLYKDLQEFVDLVPTDKFIATYKQYAANDAEVQNGLNYMYSEEFKSLVKEVNVMPEYINALNYVYNAGVDIYSLVNRFLHKIGVEPLNPPSFSEYATTGGFKGLVEDLKKLIPEDKVKALYHEKLQTSPSFKELFDRLHSEEFAKIVNTVYDNPRFAYILKKAKEHGLDVKHVKDILCRLGIGFRGCQY